jgi:hypothetical protein
VELLPKKVKNGGWILPHSAKNLLYYPLTVNLRDKFFPLTSPQIALNPTNVLKKHPQPPPVPELSLTGLVQVGRDPEANRYKRVKEEEERLRASMRRDSKQKRVKERSSKHGLTSGYLEGGAGEDDDSDDEEGVSLAAIKNRYKGKKGENKLLASLSRRSAQTTFMR